MGAPKQKWTAEEEAALKAGISKHGTGKWRLILQDPEFSHVLNTRSNVDLKDKFRNLCVMSGGWGSRSTSKKIRQIQKHDDNPLAITAAAEDINEDEILDAQPIAISCETQQIAGPKKPTPKLDSLIVEAIAKLKEPTGSSKAAITTYIEDNYWPPPDQRSLSEKLSDMTANGKFVKVKHKYRIAPSSTFSDGRNSQRLLLDGRQREPSRLDRNDFKPLTKSQVDTDLARMGNMTTEEAAAAAAQAIAEAEAAILEAEEAARAAEAAEADAEAAQAFAEAAMLMLKNGQSANLMARG